MSKVNRQIVGIPAENLNGMDRMFGSMMNLDIDNMPAKFRTAFDKTREMSFQSFSMKGMYESYEVDRVEADRILLKKRDYSGITPYGRYIPEVIRTRFSGGHCLRIR